VSVKEEPVPANYTVNQKKKTLPRNTLAPTDKSGDFLLFGVKG
jgi:hypothetical protein